MVIIDYDQQQHLVQQRQQQSVFRVNHILDPEVIIYVPRLHIDICMFCLTDDVWSQSLCQLIAGGR